MNDQDWEALASILRGAWPQVKAETLDLWRSRLASMPIQDVMKTILDVIDHDESGKVPPLGRILAALKEARRLARGRPAEMTDWVARPWASKLQGVRIKAVQDARRGIAAEFAHAPTNAAGNPYLELLEEGGVEKVRAECVTHGLAEEFDAWFQKNRLHVKIGNWRHLIGEDEFTVWDEENDCYEDRAVYNVRKGFASAGSMLDIPNNRTVESRYEITGE